MPSMLIRDLDDATIERLKERARKNRRSLQGEARSILEAAAARKPITERGDRPRRKLRLHLVQVKSGARYSRDEIYGDEGR